MYLVSRNRLASLQVIAGRGAAATNWDNSPGGWLYGITTNVNDISGQGWLGMRVVTNDGQTAGGGARNVIRPTTDTYQTVSYQITTVGPTDANISANYSATYMPHIVPPVVSTSGIPRYSILGCQDGPCTVNTFPYWDSASNNTFNGSISVQWNTTSNVASPAINNNLVFRVGGVPVTTGNPIYSFEGGSRRALTPTAAGCPRCCSCCMLRRATAGTAAAAAACSYSPSHAPLASVQATCTSWCCTARRTRRRSALRSRRG